MNERNLEKRREESGKQIYRGPHAESGMTYGLKGHILILRRMERHAPRLSRSCRWGRVHLYHGTLLEQRDRMLANGRACGVHSSLRLACINTTPQAIHHLLRKQETTGAVSDSLPYYGFMGNNCLAWSALRTIKSTH